MNMTTFSIRPARQGDEAEVLRLNEGEERWTSHLNHARLAELAAIATYYRVACIENQVVGFLLGMHDHCIYVNENFQWFKDRFENFFYIDRIVVDTAHAGKGLGRAIYSDAFRLALSTGADVAVCEYTANPLNEPSKHFHANMGFKEVGRRELAGSDKAVSMQRLNLAGAIELE